MKKKNVGILIFDDVELLDFAGPYEVFSRTRTVKGTKSRLDDETACFNTFTFSVNNKNIIATGNVKIVPNYHLGNLPKVNILLIPGGLGTRRLLEDEKFITWLSDYCNKVQVITSVCTGSLLLAKAGILKNKKCTTHWGALDLLSSLDQSLKIIKNQKVVDDTIITSAGVSSGIDMAFYIVSKICGEIVAKDTAKYIEYKWRK